jgi:Family of unknown function (DUF5996)
MPVEIPDAISFDQDKEHSFYDPEYANRFWRILLQVDRVFTLFRSRFLGKVSPVHFFWGSFDIAVTRFSGRSAPLLQSDFYCTAVRVLLSCQPAVSVRMRSGIGFVGITKLADAAVRSVPCGCISSMPAT